MQQRKLHKCRLKLRLLVSSCASSKRTHSSLDGRGGSGSGSGSGLSEKLSPLAKKNKKNKKRRTPAGPGMAASLSAPAAARPRSRPASTAGSAGAAAAGATRVPAHPSAAHRGGRGANATADGVEFVRQVSVDERIAENQRKQGVIDLGAEDGGLTPPSMPIRPTSSARAAAKGGRGVDGGVSRNLAVAEGWTQPPPSNISVPVKPESSVGGRSRRTKQSTQRGSLHLRTTGSCYVQNSS